MPSTKINYLELPCTDFAAIKAFYGNVFGWSFTDYGDDYTAFNDGFIDGGGNAGEIAHVTRYCLGLIADFARDPRDLTLAARQQRHIGPGLREFPRGGFADAPARAGNHDGFAQHLHLLSFSSLHHIPATKLPVRVAISRP